MRNIIIFSSRLFRVQQMTYWCSTLRGGCIGEYCYHSEELTGNIGWSLERSNLTILYQHWNNLIFNSSIKSNLIHCFQFRIFKFTNKKILLYWLALMSSKGYHISLLLKIDQNLIFWKDENPIEILQFCNNLLISLCTQISLFLLVQTH